MVKQKIVEGFPGGSVVKNPPANAEDRSDIRIVVINGNEGLEVDLEFCFICFFNEKDLTQIWQSMISIKSTCL